MFRKISNQDLADNLSIDDNHAMRCAGLRKPIEGLILLPQLTQEPIENTTLQHFLGIIDWRVQTNDACSDQVPNQHCLIRVSWGKAGDL